MFLAVGILAGILDAKKSGLGQVVDAAMTEGSAYLALGCFGLAAMGQWSERREDNYLDGGAHFWRCYETKDNKFVSVGALEEKFYARLVRMLGMNLDELPPQWDRDHWPAMRERFASAFMTKTRDEWCAIMEGTDACFAPVLGFREAPDHAHAKARESFIDLNGVIQPAPAPKFSRTPSSIKSEPSLIGGQTCEALAAWGIPDSEIALLRNDGAIGLLA